MFLECGQSCGCSLQLVVHILALLLGQSKLCYLLLYDGDGCGIVALDATQSIEYIVKVATATDGSFEIAEEVAPVAVIQRIKKYLIGTFGTLQCAAPFVDVGFRLEEGILGHVEGHLTGTQCRTPTGELLDAQAQLAGHAIQRTAQAAATVQFLVDILQVALGILNAPTQLVETLAKGLPVFAFFLLVCHLAVLRRQFGVGLFHFRQTAGGGLGHGVHLSQTAGELQHTLVHILKCATCFAALVGIAGQPLGCPFQFVVILVTLDT